MSEFIRIPFGYLLDFLYQFTSNYGVSLLLFSLFVKLILLPFSAKSKKSMMQMSRMAPLTQAIQQKYPNDPQKANIEISKIYKEEGVSMFGGCLWSLLPLFIIFPLFYVIREPLVYVLHYTKDQAAQMVSLVKELSPEIFGSNSYYDQVALAPHLSEFAEQIKAAIPELADKTMHGLNFQFLGVNLGQIPDFKFWAWEAFSWNKFGGLLLPILSAGSQVLTMVVSQKLNNSVTTDKDGNLDNEAAKNANKTANTMMWIMPLISLWIGFTYPCSLSLYWMSQGIFGMAQDAILTKKYRKLYDAEDNIKRRIAAEKAALKAERERQRAKRREENPNGIMENTSKKKLQRQQQILKEHEIAANKKANASEKEDDSLSGIPERPFCKGRAYVADRYKSTGNPSDDIEE